MKQGILAVSFGSTVAAARTGSLYAVEEALAASAPELPFYRAYTSPTIRRRLQKQGISCLSLADALAQMGRDGIECPLIVPTHLLPGVEFSKISATVEEWRPHFKKVLLSQPLLGMPDDLRELAELMMETYPAREDRCVLFMGHGTYHFVDIIYPALQGVFDLAGRSDLRVATVDGWPAVEDAIPTLPCKKVLLVPLMLVAGEHAHTDMAGPQEDSWVNLLKDGGFEPEPVFRGLGEMPEIRDCYVRHLSQLREQV